MKKKILVATITTMMATAANSQWIRHTNTDVVIDMDNDLMWQDDESTGINELDWGNAMSYCSILTLAGFDDWRLPDIDTLKALYPQRSNLKNVVKDYYWSSSVDAKGSARSWIVGFNAGDSSNFDRSDSNLVRCVRDNNSSIHQ